MTYANWRRPVSSAWDGKYIHVLAFLIFVIFLSAPSAAAADDRDDRTIRVMTYNLDEGTDFQELAAARSPGDFIAAVGTTFTNIQATKPAERAAAIAREIARKRPDLVGLQEASILRTGSTVPATTVQSDLLQLLLDELAKLGQHYGVVAIVPGLDATAPSPLGFLVRLTTQDAIIARTDLAAADLKLSNVQARHFATNLIFPSAIGPITFTRGWASVDTKVRGRTFRFVTTHLEVVPPIQMAQAMELLQSAANTTLPVVFAGDFNATADSGLDPTFATYQSIINSGFVEAWRQARAPHPGFTCCQAPNLLNATSTLNHRSDLILFRGAFAIADIHLIGNKPADRTGSGLWPSDHAGVAATLVIPGEPEQEARR